MADQHDVTIGETPQGKTLAETSRTPAPSAYGPNVIGQYGYWLGDAGRRYGKLQSSRSIPMYTKLEMIRDSAVWLGLSFMASTLLRAKRVIECADEVKQRFFDAMFRAWEREFVLQATMGMALGSVGLIKRFQFAVPESVEVDADPVWTSIAKPFILTGFDQCYPVGSRPRFDQKRRRFKGMVDATGGNIDVFYSLWLTFRRAWAFGSYWGVGRLDAAYADWWMKYFGRDLYLVHLQRNIDRVTKVGYPVGKTDGVDNQTIALGVGDAARAGSTVALPTDTYNAVDSMTGEEKPTSNRRWTLDVMEAAQTVERFHEVDNHHDSRILLSLLVPPQTVMDVKQSSLGGPTTADVLTELAESLLMLDAADADMHLNRYAFPAVDRANFPPDSPPVRIKTVGLEPDARDFLAEALTIVLSRADIDPTEFFDLREAAERLGFIAEGDPENKKADGDGEDGPDEAPEGLSADAGDDEDPPDDVLRRIADDRLPPLEDGVAIMPDDVKRAYRKLKTVFPELVEEEEEGEGEGE